MIFGVYTRPDGAYLLVPACMRASAEAERLHGPLKFIEMMGWTDRPAPDIWTTVMDELDRHSFVVLQDAAAQSLLEAEGIVACKRAMAESASTNSATAAGYALTECTPG